LTLQLSVDVTKTSLQQNGWFIDASN